MSEHTPGPWAVDVMPGEVVVYEAVTLKNVDICQVLGNDDQDANAKLIAAAPALLAALRFIMAFYEPDAAGYLDTNAWKQAESNARAAIAAATGAQP